MQITSTNKIKLYFQVTFSLVLPLPLLEFPNQLTQERIQLTDVSLYR